MSDTASGTDPDPQAGRQKRAIPDLFLLQYLPIIPRGVALDLGAGNGRNSIFLAEHGFEVDAFDRGTESVAELMTAARERNLPIRAIRNEVTTLTILPKRYSLAVIAWVLMFLRRGERDGVVKMAIRGLLPGGFIYLGVFSTHDPGYALCKEKFEEIEERTFFVPKRKMTMHYFIPEEVKALLGGLEEIAFKEGYEMDIGHGEPHHHGRIEVIARLPKE
ncbi:methyltransferase domain-containing protein [candidate division WOR-3 bacterium]|nr:methyltransferase domain-containing protein [candidate division WOR-3 bacterium]